MGYTTTFDGHLVLDRPLELKHFNYLKKFSRTRRMRRDAEKAEAIPDWERMHAGLPIGDEGAYFVGGAGFAGQDRDVSVVDHNHPPAGQPGLWCQWTPDPLDEVGPECETSQIIGWDGGEKFYNYVEWLRYLIEHFLDPWGYLANGKIEWAGESSDDRGIIVVKNNVLNVVESLSMERQFSLTEEGQELLGAVVQTLTLRDDEEFVPVARKTLGTVRDFLAKTILVVMIIWPLASAAF